MARYGFEVFGWFCFFQSDLLAEYFYIETIYVLFHGFTMLRTQVRENSDCKYVLKPLGFEPPIPFSGSSWLCPNTYSLSPADSKKVRVPGIPAWLWQQKCSNFILVPDRLKHRANKRCLQVLCNTAASVHLRTVSWEVEIKAHDWMSCVTFMFQQHIILVGMRNSWGSCKSP